MLDDATRTLTEAFASGDADAIRAASDAASNVLAALAPSRETEALEALVLRAHPTPFGSAEEARRNA